MFCKIKAEKFLTIEGFPVFRNISSAYAEDIFSAVSLNLQRDDPKLIIIEILGIYSKFSKVSGLSN